MIMLILNLYELLKTESDENHRLSHKEIADLLWKKYGEKADRKTLRKDLLMLSENDSNICFDDTKVRVNKNGEEENLTSGWYYSHPVTDAELRLMIDSLLFSKDIPYSQCKELINKLKGLSSRYFDVKVDYIRNLPEDGIDNKQLFYTIDIIDEAIRKHRQVSFHYSEYKTDKKLHDRMDAEGKVRNYIINPYQIAATNGRYYLICNNDKYDNLSYYRLERIRDIYITEDRQKPYKTLKGCEHGLDLPKHMAEHIYMMSGECVDVVFSAEEFLITHIIDWFGKDVRFYDETEDKVKVRVTVNEKAMFFWLMQYGKYVEVLKPASLREEIRLTAEKMGHIYNKDEDNRVTDDAGI